MPRQVPLNKGAARRMENSVRDYMTLDGLLFMIVPCGREWLWDSSVYQHQKPIFWWMFIIQVLLGDTLDSLSVIRLYVEGFIFPILPNNWEPILLDVIPARCLRKAKSFRGLPEAHKFKHTSYEAHQYGHETNATAMGTHISWCYCVKYLIIWWHYPFILPEFNTS